MSVQLGWQEIALRLFLTLVAGALIGLNREEHGRSAGLRTMMLVCLAASMSMIQANLLLGMSGKTSSSFAVMDLMRLPLGILSGMGFIGAGAILRKDNLITGVTTAATLWFTTVLGLCFGGGQIGLGLGALTLALIVLWGFKALEARLSPICDGMLTVLTEDGGIEIDEIARQVEADGGKISRWLIASFTGKGRLKDQTCEVSWPCPAHVTRLPTFVAGLSQGRGVVRVEWKVVGKG